MDVGKVAFFLFVIAICLVLVLLARHLDNTSNRRKVSKFATFNRDGSVSVDIDAYFRSPEGREELRKSSKFCEAMIAKAEAEGKTVIRTESGLVYIPEGVSVNDLD